MMTIIDNLETVCEQEVPIGSMLARTTLGATNVDLYGTNGRGFRVPLNRIDEFIGELGGICIDPEGVYRLGNENSSVEIPGNRLAKVEKYLNEARSFGVKFREYRKTF